MQTPFTSFLFEGKVILGFHFFFRYFMCMFVCHVRADACEGQRRAFGPLQMVVSHYVRARNRTQVLWQKSHFL